MDIREFMVGNDIIPKIRAALEEIAVGQGYGVFDGLQNGECMVVLNYDGVNIHLRRFERLTPQELKIEDKITAPGPASEDVAFSSQAARGRRTTKRSQELGES